MSIFKKIFFLFTLVLLTNCSSNSSETNNKVSDKNHSHLHQHSRMDTHSFSDTKKAVTKHLNLNLKADFDNKTLTGFAQYEIENNQSPEIIFDTRDLKIEKVTTGKNEKPTTFTLGENKEYLGQSLNVKIEPTTKIVTIYYQTSPTAAAVQWLNPMQTSGKKHPFLFTQGQAILTRTWIPCQDSPGVRMTYNATIEVPKDLLAVMSASNPKSKNETGVYNFEMRQPIPPYLIALAIGDLEFGEIGPRTAVYAEPDMLKKSVYEFGDMEKMLVASEELYGKYQWDRYDVIVLPPSFPFGGMENPRLTFATPTIIAGDRSLTALIAHEMAHSWSGNLVTNATWNDFWLNEGFTVYFERRIMEALYKKDYSEMLALLGQQDLESEIKTLDAHDTHLHLSLENRDPDEGMTNIAYEKGYFFLRMLEEKYGRKNFDAFLKKYFEVHAFKTITTSEFVGYLKENLLKNDEVNIDEWIYGAGLPDNMPKVVSDKFKKVDLALHQFTEGGKMPDKKLTDSWTTHEWLHFIRHLRIGKTEAQKLDKTYQFSNSGNNEILAAWFEISIENGYYKDILPKIETFLVNVGRRKFLTPLYKALKDKNDLKTAQAIYKKARPNYHSVSTQTMDNLLEM